MTIRNKVNSFHAKKKLDIAQNTLAEGDAFPVLTEAPPPGVTDPSGSDVAINVLEDTLYVFGLSDFGYSDIDGHAFIGVFITTLPTHGFMSVGVPITTGDFVTAATIASGESFLKRD